MKATVASQNRHVAFPGPIWYGPHFGSVSRLLVFYILLITAKSLTGLTVNKYAITHH